MDPSNARSSKINISKRLLGLFLFLLGISAIVAPLWAGHWAVIGLGFALTVDGLVGFLTVLRTREKNVAIANYLTAILSLLAGLLLISLPDLIMNTLIVGVGIFFLFDALNKILSSLRTKTTQRIWMFINGLINLGLGYLAVSAQFGVGSMILGVLIGVRVMSHGWSLWLAPSSVLSDSDLAISFDSPFDAGLRLPISPQMKIMQTEIYDEETGRRSIDQRWCFLLLVIFFFIHFGRMEAQFNFVSMISPFVSVLGDIGMALLAALLIIIPIRLFWRRFTRPIERSAWRYLESNASSRRSVMDFGLRAWLKGRLRFTVRMKEARISLKEAFWRTFRIGLPLTAVLIATNPIWGFSWFFNSENWVSGFWQKVVETRVDDWREAMVLSVKEQYQNSADASQSIFQLHPQGIQGEQDFSFIVIGDPGEGDPSQLILHDQILKVGAKPEVKFMLVSTDVIYPGGDMKDYEFNFYLPFKGFTKPIYAIPGNHDWFDSLEGFNANFLEPKAAKIAMQARVKADRGLTSTTDQRIDRYLKWAQKLRNYYGIQTGKQKSPYFEIQSDDFTLIAVETGILKQIDDVQMAWLKSVLEKSQDKYVMVLLGHPIFAGGQNMAVKKEKFNQIYQLLKRYQVPLVMGGDTHDFEYYQEVIEGVPGFKNMHHFVNGGGGAFLSIGTAMDWPKIPPVSTFAIYPSKAEIVAKLDEETPRWKMPIWYWVKYLHGWPFSSEFLSASFDFNRVPSFQSFMEVRIERSKSQIRLLLYGSQGPLKWKDLQRSSDLPPSEFGLDSAVEFIFPLKSKSGSKNSSLRTE